VRYPDFEKILLRQPGIIRVERLTDEVADELCYLEYSTDNVGFAPNYSLGLIDIFEKDAKMVLFCSPEFEMFTEPFMDIVNTGKGKRIGHDVMDSDLEKYDSKTYIWLTDNVFCDMAELTRDPLWCVMRSLSMDIEGFSEDMDPRVFYPCSASAEYLNGLFSCSDEVTATVLLGVNGVEYDRSIRMISIICIDAVLESMDYRSCFRHVFVVHG
jgi:hypothetical protein